MVLTRKLSDLYVVGRELVLDDGKGEPVTVYIRKITPLDADEAYREANAAKARALTAKTDPEALIFQIIRERCDKLAKDEMVEALTEIELQKKRLVLEAELEAEDKWSKDDYLQGLHDAWESGLKERHFDKPDEETQRVLDEMTEFQKQLDKRLEKEAQALRKDLESLSATKIKDRFFDEQFERQGEVAWITEFRKQELFHAVRDPEDHDVRAFEDARQIDSVSPKLIEELRTAYNNLSIEVLEGKD